MFANFPLKSWVARSVRAGATITTAVVLALVLLPAAPASGQAPESQAIILNLQHTLVVRKAFLQDKELARLNLGVKVENRVAHLWGGVPSNQVLARALKTARDLPDIVDVRHSLYLEAALEPQYLPEPDSTWAAPPLPPETGKTTAENTTKPTSIIQEDAAKTSSAASSPGLWQAAAPEKNTSFKATPIFLPGDSEDQALFVLPAIAIPVGPQNDQEAPGLAVAYSLTGQVQQLKAQDSRFHHLQILIEGGRVYLHGTAPQWNDVHRLAKAIAQLPGVENVVIGQVQIKAGK